MYTAEELEFLKARGIKPGTREAEQALAGRKTHDQDSLPNLAHFGNGGGRGANHSGKRRKGWFR